MVTPQTTDVFATVVGLLGEIIGDVELVGFDITRDTTFHEDLQLESIDLVTFAGILTEHFGTGVNLADHLAEKDLEEVIELRVGDIVDYVAARTG
ncbi:acyl carrier protein [Amycolatopsis anabasis]|uniref:acyl carrier protein n=1 Tax=Amycolatopsis anabasis TaxID=1840409 RepID=UPI00131E2983|nr:phosphopantetheine-binding protein [Amycolatopsis anabasis]